MTWVVLRRLGDSRWPPRLTLVIIGLIAVVSGGFSGPMSDPVVNVVGFTHTTTLGLTEIGAGVCLLVSGAARSRAGAAFFGSSMAWLAVVVGAGVTLTALLLPRFAKRSSTITQGSR